jgi:hypothetical protein
MSCHFLSYGEFHSVNFISVLIGHLNYINIKNNITRAESPGLSLTISKSFRHRSKPSHANNISSVSSVTTFRLKFDVIWNIQSSFYCIDHCSNKLSAYLELSIICYYHSMYCVCFVLPYLFFTLLFDSIFHPNSSSSILVSLRMLPKLIL